MQTTTVQDTLRDSTAVIAGNEPGVWIWLVLVAIVLGLSVWASRLYRRSKKDEPQTQRPGGGGGGDGRNRDDGHSGTEPGALM